MLVELNGWDGHFVIPSVHSVKVAPAIPLAKRSPISKRVGERLIHSDRLDQIQKVDFFANDSRIVASNSPKNNLQIWNANNKTQIAWIQTPEELKYTDQFWSVLDDSRVISFLQKKAKVRVVEEAGKVGTEISYQGSELQTWSLNSGKFLGNVESGSKNQVRDFYVSDDKRYLSTDEMASGVFFDAQPNQFSLYELTTKKWRRFPVGTEAPIVFTKDSKYCAAFFGEAGSYATKGIRIYQLPDLQLKREIKFQSELIKGGHLGFSNDGEFLVAETKLFDRKNDWKNWRTDISCYQVASGKLTRTRRLKERNFSIDFGHRPMLDETIVYWNWNGRDKNIVALSVPELKPKWQTPIGQYDLVRSVHIEPNGKWLASICYPDDSKFSGRNLEVDWELVSQSEMVIVDDQGKLLERLILPVGASTLAFNKDGSKAALGAVGSVYLMDFSMPFGR